MNDNVIQLDPPRDWLWSLKNRAERLGRLIELNAPKNIIEAEICLVEQSIKEYRQENKDV